MKRFLRICVRSSSLRSPLVTLDFTLLLAAPAFAQGTGNSAWENAVSVLQQAFTSTIARGLSLALSAGPPKRKGCGGKPRQKLSTEPRNSR